MTSRTPAWWRSLPTWAQVAILSLLLPGVVLHELTHALAARPWVTTSFDWDTIAVEMGRDDEAALPLAIAQIAPLVSGYAAAVGVLLAVGSQRGVTVPDVLLSFVGGLGVAAIGAYILVNWLLFTFATIADLAVFLHYWRAYRAETDVHTHSNP